MQGLGGLAPGLNRGATMSGNKAGGARDPYPIKFMVAGLTQNQGAVAPTSFTADKTGFYQFAAWGAGNTSTSAAASLAIRTVWLIKDQIIPIVVGSSHNSGTDYHTTVTFPDVAMVAQGNGGSATGGDVNVSAVGAVAGTYGGYIGGPRYCAPGGGSNGGLVIVTYLGM